MSEEQDDAYSDACEEIERLKASRSRSLDLIQRQTKFIAEKLTEIERLKAELELREIELTGCRRFAYEEEIPMLKQLITELADALEETNYDAFLDPLIQRAREAGK